MGIKEGTCCDEHWVLYVSDESLNSTPETNTTLYLTNLSLNISKLNNLKTGIEKAHCYHFLVLELYVTPYVFNF